MDRIKIFFLAENEIEDVFLKYADYIKNETLTRSFHKVEEVQKDMIEWDINGRKVHLTVEKVKK